jgi:4'-phosphopantetheinyl transferase
MSALRLEGAAMALSTSVWESPPEALQATDDEVHVWRAPLLTQTPAGIEAFRKVLSADEHTRADSFRFERDRRSFIVGRGILRTIVGYYLHLPPADLCFSYNPFGKPGLYDALGVELLCFNLSHASGQALYAITRSRMVGIDIEYLREDFASMEIAERFFSRREVMTLRALPADMRARAFFDCWTRKEAYIKARGEGLSMPLDQFEVSLIPGSPAELISAHGDPRESARWSLCALDSGPNYAAAVAVEGSGWRLCCWQWPDNDHNARNLAIGKI